MGDDEDIQSAKASPDADRDSGTLADASASHDKMSEYCKLGTCSIGLKAPAL